MQHPVSVAFARLRRLAHGWATGALCGWIAFFSTIAAATELPSYSTRSAVDRTRLQAEFRNAQRILGEPLPPSVGLATKVIDRGFSGAGMPSAGKRSSPAERAEMERQAKLILNALRTAPGFTAPRDLYPRFQAYFIDDHADHMGADAHYQAFSPGWIVEPEAPVLKMKPGAEAMYVLIRVNSADLSAGHFSAGNYEGIEGWKDAEGEFTAEPLPIVATTGRLIYATRGGAELILLPEGAELFGPVGLQRALKANLALLDVSVNGALANFRSIAQELERFQDPAAVQARQARREARYQDAVSKGATETALARLRRGLDREDEPHTNMLNDRLKPTKSHLNMLAAKTETERQLATLDAAALAAPACVQRNPQVQAYDGAAHWIFLPRGAPHCLNLVEVHPKLRTAQPSGRANARVLTMRLRDCVTGLYPERFDWIVSNHKNMQECRFLINVVRDVDWVALRRGLFKP
jgi:hypothetical protein